MPPYFCPNCGIKIKADYSEYCPKCGIKIGSKSPQTPTPPPPTIPIDSSSHIPPSSEKNTVAEEKGIKKNWFNIAILLIGFVIVAAVFAFFVLGAGFFTPHTLQPTVVTPIPTPVPTTAPQISTKTTIPTPTLVVTTTLTPGLSQVIIPSNGVWVRASYPGTYIGLIGTPGNQLEVSGTGDKLYQIPTSEGTVAATLQKKDGSSDKILLEIYKNGVMLQRESSIAPKGIVVIQLDLKNVPSDVEQSTTNIQMIGGVYGISANPAAGIDEIRFTIGLAPGASPIDLTKMKIVYSTPSTTPTILTQYTAASTGMFTTKLNGATSVSSMTANEQVEIAFKVAGVGPNTKMTIELRPSIGAALPFSKTAPPTILATNILY